MIVIGRRGVYGDPVLPDFMVFLNWKALPWFWYGFDRFWFAMAMVHAYRATVTLSRVVSCVKGRREFARVAWRLAATPSRAPHSGSQTLTCRFLRLRP
jgi:hypothetical protein